MQATTDAGIRTHSRCAVPEMLDLGTKGEDMLNPIPLPYVQAATKFLPEGRRERAFVAGGAVRDWELTRDVDLWVPAGPASERIVAEECWTYLCGLRDEYEVTLNENFLGGEGVEYPEGFAVGIVHGLITTPAALSGHALDLQIVVMPMSEPSEVLAHFDISEHAHAILLDGSLMSARDSTVGGPLHVLRTTTPRSTIRRVLRLADRYDLEVPWHEIDVLIAEAQRLERGQQA
jgi:hypothetical protein